MDVGDHLLRQKKTDSGVFNVQESVAMFTKEADCFPPSNMKQAYFSLDRV